jgi:hypothetical protein
MSADEIKHFLVVYDVRARLAKVKEFDNYDEALAEYETLEKANLTSTDLDIVLLGADSLETIKRTHSSYFDTTEDGFERFFKDALLAT